jgi:hypothetical protein
MILLPRAHPQKQVMIPDVQKLINQSGHVSVDIFNTRLMKPPTSVLVFPLKVWVGWCGWVWVGVEGCGWVWMGVGGWV